MQDENLAPNRHSCVKINGSLVHLVQYGLDYNLLDDATDNSAPQVAIRQTSEPTKTNPAKAKGQTSIRSGGAQHADSKQKQPEQLVIFVPGNPGILDIYQDYLGQVFEDIRKSRAGKRYSSAGCEQRNANQVGGETRIAILGISHNNMDIPNKCDYLAERRLSIDQNELNFVEQNLAESLEPHDIELQVLNKLIILKRILKSNLKCRLVFIGHSIGCYIILRLLQDKTISQKHSGSILLHPALENLASTEKGLIISTLFKYKIDLALKYMLALLDLILPKEIKVNLAKWLILEQEFLDYSSKEAQNCVGQLISLAGIAALVEMAKSEFEFVKDMDHNLMIKPHVEKLRLIYAQNDHWVNPAHRLELRANYPNLHIEEQQDAEHVFMMKQETLLDYATRSSNFIRDFFDSQNKTKY